MKYGQFTLHLSASSLVWVNICLTDFLVQELGKIVALETTELVVFMNRKILVY